MYKFINLTNETVSLGKLTTIPANKIYSYIPNWTNSQDAPYFIIQKLESREIDYPKAHTVYILDREDYDRLSATRTDIAVATNPIGKDIDGNNIYDRFTTPKPVFRFNIDTTELNNGKDKYKLLNNEGKYNILGIIVKKLGYEDRFLLNQASLAKDSIIYEQFTAEDVSLLLKIQDEGRTHEERLKYYQKVFARHSNKSIIK